MFRAVLRPSSQFSRYYSTGANKCLVLAEHNNTTLNPITLNAITAAKRLGSEVNVLVLGSKCNQVVDSLSKVDGVNKVLFQDNESHHRLLPETVSLLLEQLQGKHNFSHIIAPATANGKNILPRFAATQDVQPISEVVSIESPDTFVGPIYAGNALRKIQSSDKLKVLTIRPTAFEAASIGGNSATTEDVSISVSQNLSKWESEELAQSDRPELTAAKVIISGGRGMKGPENFKLLEKLADQFGGAVGASRAAVDDGWVPNDMQVGQTGKVVAPELYIAVGISGAIQHIAGMKDSKVIVVINKDAEAPFFQLADYGLVADLFTAVPELTEKLAAKQK